MRKEQFINKHQHLKIAQSELERKWRVMQEQEELQKMWEAAQLLNTTTSTSVAGGGGNGDPNNFQFVVNTTQELIFNFNFTSTNEPINFTIDWGDGTIHEDSGFGGFYTEEHEYAEAGEYTVKVTFDDPLKILELDFPGWNNEFSTLVSITGLQTLANLQEFRADYNSLVRVNFSGMTTLTYVDISDCDDIVTEEKSLTSVNVSGCANLEELRLDDSDFSAGIPNLSGLDQLIWIDMDQSDITGSIDLSFLPSLNGFDLSGNPELTEVIISSSQALGGERNVDLNSCALTQEVVDKVLDELSMNGVSGGYVDLSGGTNSIPSSTGLAAKTLLEENGWTVLINTPPPGTVTIAPSTDFDIVGDFTIEMFINLSNDSGFPRPYSFGAYPAPNAMSIESGQLYFWANNAALINGTFGPNLGQWYHICVIGEGSTAYLFVDGIQISSSPYSGSIPSQGLPLTIGDGNEPSSSLNGLMSNFRWTNAAVYNTTGFTPPTSPLTDETDTVLLILQGESLNAQLTDNSGNGNNGFGSGAITYNTDNPFVGTQGSLQVGIV